MQKIGFLLKDPIGFKRAIACLLHKTNDVASQQHTTVQQWFRYKAWLMRYVKLCVSSVKVPLRTAGYNRHLGRNRFISTKQKWFHSTFSILVWLKQPTLSRVISSTILLLGFNRECFSNVLTIFLDTVARKQFSISKMGAAGHYNNLIIQHDFFFFYINNRHH